MQGQVGIFLADGFEETSTVNALVQFRNAGYSTRLLSLTSGLQRGAHGIHMQPDNCISQLSAEASPFAILILAGGIGCQQQLLSDPRFHNHIHSTNQYGGEVVILSRYDRPTVEQLLSKKHSDLRMVLQPEISSSPFIEYLKGRVQLKDHR